MKTKIVYVVISNNNDFYWEQAWASAYSVKLHTPTAHITFVTDDVTYTSVMESKRKKSLYVIDEIVPIHINEKFSNMQRSRWLKTNLRNLINGDFLFIDTDTIITSDISDIDNLKCNMAAVYDSHCKFKEFPFNNGVKQLIKKVYGIKLSSNTEYFNSGVLYVKDNKYTSDFYNQWHENWLYSKSRGVSTDQPSLAKTNNENKGFISILDGVYNCQVAISIQYLNNAKIMHFFNAKWSDQNLNPFFGKDLYLKIKMNGEITNDIHDKILRCKELFISPSKIIGHNEIDLWFSPACEFLKWTYAKCKFIYKLQDYFFRIMMKMIK